MSVLDEILDIAATALPAAGVRCLLVGGFAVNYYGYTRNTLDVDFMIVSDHVDNVRRVMREAGFTNVSVSDTVVFFSKPNDPWRVDFLRVDAETMQALQAKAVSITLHGHPFNVPALLDLIAMKIFSISQSPARRIDKDLPDIAYLAVLNNLDPERDLQQLCRRFGSEDIYRQIKDKIGQLSV
jgi:hypothetical protein